MRNFLATFAVVLLSASLAASKYVLVMDAGSSGTRVYVYGFEEHDTHSRVPKLMQNYDTQEKKIKPGISAVAESSDESTIDDAVSENLHGLIQFAKEIVIDPEERKHTPVLFEATAGMRALDTIKQDMTLRAVRKFLHASEFKFEDAWAEISKGKREAGLSWIAANFLAGTLAADETETFGLVEMGGASTQVTFEMADEVEFSGLSPDKQFIFRDLKGKLYNLYAVSYMNYGQDYAMNRYYEEASSTHDPEPCCMKQQQCGPAHKHEGSGDYETCHRLVRDALFSTDDFSVPASPVSKLIATENFFYTRNDVRNAMQSASESDIMDLSKAHAFGSELCEGSDVIRAADPHRKLCFSAAYQAAFIDALQLPSDDYPKVKRKINGVAVSWTLGSALVHSITHTDSSEQARFLSPARYSSALEP